MSHRAQQIVDAIAAEIALGVPNAAIFTHRSLSVSEADQELPAVSVRYGADAPIEALGASNVAFLDSLLELQTIALVRANDETALLSGLLDLRRQIHVALMANRSQGLAFVIDTRYAGAGAPEVDASSEYLAGRLEVRWLVHYRMNITDPS